MARPLGRRTDATKFDEVMVRRMVGGETLTSKPTVADNWEAVRRLAALGMHDGQIAHRLRRHRTSVTRTRNHLSIPPVIPRDAGAANQTDIDAPTRPREMK